MADSKNLILAYCTQNQALADSIASDLAKADYVLSKTGCGSSPVSLREALTNSKGKVLLLLTDNLLKSTRCMHGLLPTVRELLAQDRLIVLVAEGRIPKLDGSGWEAVSTSFEKVSNVIQYMNYWQDKYLELRREYRQKPENPNLEAEVENSRAISGEVGEMLRLMRIQKCYQLDAFREKAYAMFFQIVEDPENHNKLRELLGAEMDDSAELPTGNERSLVELIEDSSEELMAENLELDHPEFHPIDEQVHLEEFSEDELSSIPGIEILKQKEMSEDLEDEEPEEKSIERKTTFTKVFEGSMDKDQMSIDDLSELRGTSIDALDEMLNELLDEDDEKEEIDLVFNEEEESDEELLDNFFEDEEYESLVPKANTSSETSTLGKKPKPPTAEDALEVGIKLFNAGEMEQAIGFLQGAVEGQPDDIALRYYYAYALARYAHQFKRASLELEILLKLDPSHVDSWFLLAELAEVLEDYPAATKYFTKVAELQDDYPDVYYRLGLLALLHHKNQKEEAAEYFQEALEQDPKNMDACYRFATLQSEILGEPENAAINFQKVLEAHPDHKFANYNLALIYYKLGKIELAYDFYQKAIAINPELKTEQNDNAFIIDHSEEPELEDTSEQIAEQDIVKEAGYTYMDSLKELDEEESETEAIAIVFENPLSSSEKAEESTSSPSQSSIPQVSSGERAQIAPGASKTSAPEAPVVFISGATAGIGLATAREFAKNGYRIIITGRRLDRLEAVKTELNSEFGSDVHYLPFDVRDLEAVHSAFENLPEKWQKVDVLINNAGLSRGLAPIHEGQVEHWDTMIDTNIKGLLYLTRAISPQMVKRRSGHIINVCSSAGKEVYPSGNVYCATKFAVDALTKSIRLDLHRHNVRVSQVSPGHVEETEFARVRFDWDLERASKVYDGFQPLKASDVAETIYFIASRPAHVNIEDVLMFGTKQASNNQIDRSGR